MASNVDATNVGVGKPLTTGAMFFAPIGTTLPTDSSTPLDPAFKCVGYISEEGAAISEERDSEDIKAWGGDVVYTSQSSYKETLKVTPIEINEHALKLTYGDGNVTKGEGKLTVKHTSAVSTPIVLVLETVPNEKTVCRSVFPNAKLTEKGDLTFSDADPLGRELTFTLAPGADGATCIDYYAITGLKGDE